MSTPMSLGDDLSPQELCDAVAEQKATRDDLAEVIRAATTTLVVSLEPRPFSCLGCRQTMVGIPEKHTAECTGMAPEYQHPEGDEEDTFPDTVWQ